MSIGAQPSFSAMSTFPGGFAGGLNVQGMPILNTYPGRVFWLDSVNGSDNNRGTFARPFASLSGALSMMAAPAPTVWNDLLMVKPGHFEKISSATALSIDLSGVQIIGLGIGAGRPMIVLDTANTATINVTGSDVTFQNFQFKGNFLAIAALFTLGGATAATGISSVTASISGTTMTVSASASGKLYPGSTLHSTTSGFIPGTRIVSQLSGTTGGVGVYTVSQSQTVASGTVTSVCRNFTLNECEIRDASAILNFKYPVKTSATSNACDGLTIMNCKIVSSHTTNAAGIVNMSGTNDSVAISNNYYISATTDVTGWLPIATGKVVTNLTILNNVINLQGTSGNTAGILVTTNGSTNSGMVAGNFVQSLDATSEILATASSGLLFSQNYYSGAADKSGYLLPAADA